MILPGNSPDSMSRISDMFRMGPSGRGGLGAESGGYSYAGDGQLSDVIGSHMDRITKFLNDNTNPQPQLQDIGRAALSSAFGQGDYNTTISGLMDQRLRSQATGLDLEGGAIDMLMRRNKMLSEQGNAPARALQDALETIGVDAWTPAQRAQLFSGIHSDPEKMTELNALSMVMRHSQGLDLTALTEAPTIKDFYDGDRVEQREWNAALGQWETIGGGPRWEYDQPSDPSDLDNKIAQATALYGAGTPEYEAAVGRIIGAVDTSKTTENDAQIEALMARGYTRQQAEDIAFGYVKTVTDPVTGNQSIVNITTGQGSPIEMPNGLPKSVVTGLTEQQTILDPVIEELAGFKNALTGEGVGLGGNVLDLWNRTGGQLMPGSINQTNIGQRTQLAALRERVIQAISGDERFSNMDRSRIEQILPSTGIFESAARARQALDQVELILRSRSATITQQLGGTVTPGGGGQPAPTTSGGTIETMSDDEILSLNPAALSPIDRKKLSDRLKAMGY